jgi:glycosyltransferase involved in cell wall biosynthesis
MRRYTKIKKRIKKYRYSTRKIKGGSTDLISVIIPTYNRFKYLLATIESIKAQTYKNIEIIVVNDKSTQPEYYSHDFGKNVNVIHLEKNSREIHNFPCAGHVRNEGIKAAKGRLIAFCDDDDIWMPNKLKLQMEAMKASGCKMSCTEGFLGDEMYDPNKTYKKYNSEHFMEYLKKIFKDKGSDRLDRGFPKVWKSDFLEIHNCVITSSVVIYKEILDKIGNFNIIHTGEDYDCWKRALKYTDMIYVEEPCIYYHGFHGDGRQYGGSIDSSKPVKIFNMCLHMSVIEDVKYVLSLLYGSNIQITNWKMNDHGEKIKGLNNTPPADIKHITINTWENIDMDMIKRFQDEYDSVLSTFDAFIVTHTPVFAMIFEKYGKPIIVLNSCRYDQPFCRNKNMDMLQKFNDALKRMEAMKQLVIISHNLADQEYLKERTGVNSVYIPCLCLYTNAKYNPKHQSYIIFETHVKDKFPTSDKIVSKPSNYKFLELFEYNGIIHMPYDISTMALFEQYFAGMPLFFPTKEFYKKCINDGVIGFIVRYDKPGEILPDEELEKWLKNADYYNLKYINYYSSFEDCVSKVEAFKDTDKDARLQHIEGVKKDSLDKWKKVIDEYLMNK